jgi:hypothetical protein
MSDAVATLRENATDRRPELALVDGRFRGTRWYDITGASTLDECFTAQGLPAFGSPWSAAITRPYARGFTPTRQPGKDDFFVMRVDYGEDTGGNLQPAPGIQKTSFVEVASTSEVVDFDVTGTNKLTDDGRGVPKTLASIAFEVAEGFSQLPDLGPYFALANEPKVNAAPVTLRNFMNSGSNIAVPAERLLYGPPRFGLENGVFSVRHRLLYAENWKHRKPVLDGEGKGTGQFTELDVYELGDFGSVGL